eukprot:TRINITY_DN6105_c0_g1_i1.p1 TRINITY_DN6105_c0_g1~~TRINITY_DN6105_c0_g1_i1.p1  ORF type:complete len:642 (+),score=162.64 TRINITY_DN6105_c0_g1_i1:93-2018(+)
MSAAESSNNEKKEGSAKFTPTINKQIAWLGFNYRVLYQATRTDFPLFERLRSLAIFAENIDALFSARISTLVQNLDINAPSKEYEDILEEVHKQVAESITLYNKMVNELHGHEIHILEAENLTTAELQYFGAYLAEEVVPRIDLLDPASIYDAASKGLYLAAGVNDFKYLIRIPDSLPRLLEVPSRKNSYVRLGQLIRLRRDLFLPEELPLFELRVTRLQTADLQRLDWEAQALPSSLEHRVEGTVSRLEIESTFPKTWESNLQNMYQLHPRAIFRVSPPLDLRFILKLTELPRADLVFPNLQPKKNPAFIRDPFTYLDEQDLILHHPYDDFDMVERFLLVAAQDPNVDQIRITGYRLGPHRSVIVGALIDAARRGKDVAVLLEGRARSDELQNLYWLLTFESSGVRPIPLLPNLKVHAKVALVRQAGKYYAHLGSGNYNSVASRLETNVSLITSHRSITDDVAELFRALDNREVPNLKTIHFGAKAKKEILDGIQRERENKGRIILKVNHITDLQILQALSDAADAGAKVELLVRTATIFIHPKFVVRSIIGRFLERARVFAFENKGEWDVWIGSFELISNCFESRIELMIPVWEPDNKKKVLSFLTDQLNDTKNSFDLLPDGSQKLRTTQTVGEKKAKL